MSGSNKNRSEHIVLSVRLPPDLGKAFMKWVNSMRPKPTKKSATIVCIEEYLKSKGFWPPKEGDGE